MDDHYSDKSFGADAIVIGVPDAPSCISASSVETVLKADDDVSELTRILNTSVKKKSSDSKKASPHRNTSVKTGLTASLTEGENSGAVQEDKPVIAGTSDSAVSEHAASDEKKTKGITVGARRKRAKIITAISLSLAAILLGLVGYEVFRMMSIMDSINYVHSGINFDKNDVLVSQSETLTFVSHTDETKNILLCGVDIDENNISRTDSMIILSIDHKHKKIKMTSLMRDMYLQIPGHRKNKLNAAYTYGGGDLLLTTIYNNFGMKIDRYVCVDYAVFASVVDNLGGVEIEIEEMELEQFNKYVGGGEKNRIYQAGTYNMNGKQALSYCRIRKVGSDTARTARQRKVLGKIMNKCRNLSPVKAQNILGVAAPHITTNMTRSELTSMLLEGLSSRDYETMELRIPMDGSWTDKKTDHGWFVEINLNKNASFINQFIYGDDETAQALADIQRSSDEIRTERDRSNYNKKNKK